MSGLTRQRIIETAISVADRDGFEASTLRRIATELGVHVTSLYNHVPTRDAVTDGIVEALVAEAALPATAVPWETWVRTFFAAVGELADKHPGAFTAFERRPVQGVNAAGTFEVALAAFITAGFVPAEAYCALKATVLTTLAVGQERTLSSSGQVLETSIDGLPREQFPVLHDLPTVTDPEAAWQFTLEALVAGLHSQLRRRHPAPKAAANRNARK